MAKKLGRLMLIKLWDGAATTPAFQTIAALRSKSLTINNNAIDVTTPDPITPEGPLWTELLNGATNLSVTGSGYAVKQDAEVALSELSISGDAREDFEIVVPNIGTFAGSFMVASLEAGGEQEDGVTFGLTLNSAGAITFTPEA